MSDIRIKMAKGLWFPAEDNHISEQLDDSRMFQRLAYDTAMPYCTRFSGVAIDIGAHVGTWTLRMADRWPRVVALEADPDTFECLRMNTQYRTDTILAMNIGVGAGVGGAFVNRDAARPGNTGSHYLTEYEGKTTKKWVVRDTLDTILANCSAHYVGDRSVDFMKIDVEGMELEVLLGARSTLLKHRPTTIMEVKDLGRGVDPEKAADYLISLGAVERERVRRDRIYTWS